MTYTYALTADSGVTAKANSFHTNMYNNLAGSASASEAKVIISGQEGGLCGLRQRCNLSCSMSNLNVKRHHVDG